MLVPFIRLRTLIGGATILAALCACAAEAPTAANMDAAQQPLAAKAGGGTTRALYRLHFVDGGGIVSAPFPAEGVLLNVSDPWRSVAAVGLVELRNLTAADGTVHAGGTFGQGGTCRDRKDIDAQMAGWNLTNSTRGVAYTFAGTWRGEVALNRDRNGNYNFYLQGPAVRASGDGNGDGMPDGGEIRNIASNHNTVSTTIENNGARHTITFTQAGLGFGSPSSPDGVITLGDATLPLYEIACASFTIVAERM